jgi:hypothetical protein
MSGVGMDRHRFKTEAEVAAIVFEEADRAMQQSMFDVQREAMILAQGNRRTGTYLRSLTTGGEGNITEVAKVGRVLTGKFGTKLFYGPILENWIRPAVLKRPRPRGKSWSDNPRTPNPFKFIERGMTAALPMAHRRFAAAGHRIALRLSRGH